MAQPKTEQEAQDYLLAQGTKRDQGRRAQRMNILAAKLVAETVRTTLGPQGMDKMIVDQLGDATITNDGATILKEMNIEHPTAKMVVEVAKTQEDEVGDGTTTAVILAGELLRQAEELIEQGIHPTVIIKGYALASKTAQVVLKNMAEKITAKDASILEKLSMTAMTGKVAEGAKEHLSKLVVQAIKQVSEEQEMDIKNIKIEEKVGEDPNNSELIKGVVIDREKINGNMPQEVKNARIALIDSALEVQSTETDAKITITDPAKLQAFIDMEENMLRKLVDKIVSSGANVVLCQKGMEDIVQYMLTQKGIYACRRVKKSDLVAVSKATGAHIVTNVNDLQAKHLGDAGNVKEVKVGDEHMTMIQDCPNPKTVTLLARGATEHIAAEVKRAIDDAIGNVASALRAGSIVGGAGAAEIELSRNINHFGAKLSGKEQLAVAAYAKAMEVIPKTLAENAGLDAIDALTEMKAAHDKGNKWAGLNVYGGGLINSIEEGIIEPILVKTQAVASATDVAIMILRIDDVIIAGSPEPQTQQQGNPGMGFE